MRFGLLFTLCYFGFNVAFTYYIMEVRKRIPHIPVNFILCILIGLPVTILYLVRWEYSRYVRRRRLAKLSKLYDELNKLMEEINKKKKED